LIEDLLSQEQSPSKLTVVSNDGRVRSAAIRRGCPLLRCEEFMDALMNADSKPPAQTPLDEKQVDASEREKADWLKAFGNEP
jgi:hypothetical protein